VEFHQGCDKALILYIGQQKHAFLGRNDITPSNRRKEVSTILTMSLFSMSFAIANEMTSPLTTNEAQYSHDGYVYIIEKIFQAISNKHGAIIMKYIKVIVGLALIPLGVLGGSYIHLGNGSAAILGGILGGVFCCILYWSSGPHWSKSSRLEERYQSTHNMDARTMDNTIGSIREHQIQSEMRYHGLDRHF
jgi:hypothetical protein